MKINVLFVIALFFSFLIGSGEVSAQVSHGGKPLPLTNLRNADHLLYKEMPPFDLEETLRLDSLNERDMRSGFHFAYKFMTDFNRYNSGVSFTQPDGTKVWRLGIYSPKALSLNILFSEYKLPEGAQVFVYNEDQSKILGAFNHLNNSDLNVLPIAPIEDERIIIEYQEPENVAFPGELTIGEVNHGYRSLRRSEPNEGVSSIKGIPALTCFDDGENDYQEWGRSVVLLIIDGTTGCSGVLVNNSKHDGKPYLLTASHCLNGAFTVANPDYAKVASSIVCFYNYNSPFCSPIIRGTEEMSTASSYFRAVNVKADMALLELTETPPIYYRPLYAGWSIEESNPAPFVCIQHPQFSTKRVSLSENQPETSTFTSSNAKFYKDGHWFIKRWDTGYTASGSSGAPLFNGKGEVIGSLSGGQSYEHSPINDFFYKMGTAWNPKEYMLRPERQLKYWLDPTSQAHTNCSAFDPYQSAPCFRLSNVHASGKQEIAECAYYSGSSTDFLFGKNQKGIMEYAEAYQVNGEATLYGTYIVTPPAGIDYSNMEVEITVYSGDTHPTTLLYRENFRPSYQHLSRYENSFSEANKSLNRPQENFVSFKETVRVQGNFFVGYKLKKMPRNTNFAAYNLPKGETSKNTAWVLEGNEWKQANELPFIGYNTSLFIDPVVNYQAPSSNEQIELDGKTRIYMGTEKGIVHVSLPAKASTAMYTLYSIQGKLLKQGTFQGAEATLYFKDYETGMYVLTIDSKEGRTTQKIVF